MPGSKLFSPIRIGRITLDNRVVMAPLTRCRANKAHVHGDLAVEYYGQRASVGVIIYQALLLTGAIILDSWYFAHHRGDVHRTRSGWTR